MVMRFCIITCLTVVLYSISSNAEESDPAVKTPKISSGIPEIARRAKGGVEDFRLLAVGSRVDLQAEMTISVEQTPAVITWALECVEPGPNRIGEKKRILASQAADVSQNGQFRLSASVTRRSFFDCYAYGNGPELNVRWEEKKTYGTKRDAFFGEIIRLLIGSQFDGVRIQGFTDNDFKNLKRWRRINVFLDSQNSKTWPLVADDLELVKLETRKTTSSGEVYKSELEFAVDGPYSKILFAYLDVNGPLFKSYEYRVAWQRVGGKVFRENAEWKQGNWGVLAISLPLNVLRVEVETDRESAYSEIVVEISCDRFKERKSEIGVITPASGALTELIIACDRDAPVSYKVTAMSRDGETFQTETKPLEDRYIYVHENTFAQE